MKKRFLCSSAILIACLLSSCKLTITSFDAPATTSVGEVITLTLNGEITNSVDLTKNFAIFLQIPDNWEVLSAIAKIDEGTSDYILSHNTEYDSLFSVPSGYKVWSGIDDDFGTINIKDGKKITLTIKIRTGGVVNIGCSLGQEYLLKVIVAHILLDGKFVRDDPSEISDFSKITDDKYVKYIVIKDNSCLSAANPDLRLIFSCLQYQNQQYRLSLDYTPSLNDWKYAVGSIAIADPAQSDCISVNDAFAMLFTGK